MNYHSKKGFTLIELIAVFPLIVLIIAAGLAVFLVGHQGFQSGAEDFNGNMQATILKTLMDKNLPTAANISFSTPEEDGSAILFENGSVVFAEHYMGGTEKKFTVENVQSVTIRIANSGVNCKLSYHIVLDENGQGRTYDGAMTLLNITGAAFSAANGGVSLPVEYTISSGSATGMYITPLEEISTGNPVDENVYLDVSYTFTITNTWPGGFQYAVTITNNSDVTVYGWVIEFDYPGTLTSAWNATLENLGGNRYRLASMSYNSILAPGATVSDIGGQGTTFGGDTISNVVIKRTYDITNLNVSMRFTITGGPWNAGKPNESFNFSVTLTNHGTQDIVGWELQFNYDGVLTSVWNAEAVHLGSNPYQIKCPSGSNFVIPKNGGSISFGGSGGKVGTAVSVATVNGKSITVE